jgi:hypothetical protein
MLAVVLAAALAPAPAPPADTSAAACRYLWGQQAPDGGWHSQTYGLLRSGQALTPFVLHALLGASGDGCAAPPGAVERALAFLRRNVSAAGALGMADPDVLEYPNYATAYALRVLVRAGTPQDRALIEKMRAHLVAEQFTPAGGFGETTLVFGGWGFGGPRAPGRPGHMDIAHTRRVLQALREAGPTDPALFTRALAFLRLMQRHPGEGRAHPPPLAAAAQRTRRPRFDGGFFFSPVVLDANKGEVLADDRGAYHASYATATCDGVLALLAAGLPRSDRRVRAARGWLEGHERLDHPQGVPGGPQAWGEAIHYYHLAARAEAYAALGLSARLRGPMARELGPRQRPDGSFVNQRNHLMKEDDPLLATALALLALTPDRHGFSTPSSQPAPMIPPKGGPP